MPIQVRLRNGAIVCFFDLPRLVTPNPDVIEGETQIQTGLRQTINLLMRGKRIANCKLVVYDLPILKVFGIQSFASSEQRRGHNRRVIK